MAALNNSKVQYVGSVEWAAVAAWPGSGMSVPAGTLVTNTANSPAVGSERVFVQIVKTSPVTGVSQPTYTTTKGAQTSDGTANWAEVTGQPCVNGDTTNSAVWGASLTTVQGQTVYDSGTASCQMVTSNGGTTGGSGPAFSATAGTTTSDNTVTWTSLGLASAFGAFAAPHKRVLNADAAAWQTVVPATIYIASDHAETQTTGLNLAGGQGVAANPNQYISISKTTVPPTAVTAGASISTTTTGALGVNGYFYWYGVTFNCGSGSTGANFAIGNIGTIGSSFFDNCTFNLVSTNAGNIIQVGNGVITANSITFINPIFTFGATGQAMVFLGSNISIIGGSIAATGSIPTSLFKSNASSWGTAVIRDCDLSKETGTLYNANSTSAAPIVILENCKLGAAVTMTTGSFIDGGASFKMHNCDSGSKNYRFYEANYLGTIQQETTIVDNTNPATDGTTPISWNIATIANTAFGQPFNTEYLPIAQWNSLTTGSHTATIQFAGANSLTNADIWMEAECLDTSGFPIGTAISGRVTSPLATPVAWTTSTDSWGGSPANTQQMSVTFSPAMVGYIKVRIYV